MLVLGFQIGTTRLALDIRRVREVVPRVHLQRVSGSPDWLAGMFVYRGRAVPVVDLHHMLGAGECPPHLSSRIILVPLGTDADEAGPLLGLLAAQVAEIRELQPRGDPLPGLHGPNQPDLGATLVDEAGILYLLDLDRLLPAPVRGLLAALPGGARS